MFYIVGLGNPGAQYAQTRHNIGFVVLDACVASWGLSLPTLKKKYQGDVSEGECGAASVMLLYPQTFMNNSGLAVASLLPKDSLSRLVLVYDDVDLPIGTVKVSFGNGAGGHNGVASVIERLGSKDFIRVRIGVAKVGEETGKPIRPTGDELASYVLGKFSPAEQTVVEALLPKIVIVLEDIVRDGYERAMQRWNGVSLG